MECPKCDSLMEKITYHKITVDRCTGCKGIWFPGTAHKELKKIHGSESIDIGSEKVGRVFDKISEVSCPECARQMSRLTDLFHPHIHYEVCPIHDGVFFDAGEFKEYKDEGLVDFFKSLSWYFSNRK